MKMWIYKHYKWNNYQVIALWKHSDTLEDYVVYQWLYNSEEFGDKPIRVKPVDEFEKTLEIDWQQVKRFEYISE